MSGDLPAQGLYQQMNARSVSGEELEVLGKKASARWSDGECKTLSDAVIETVKHAGLSPEQVRRVVEFTNQDAYLSAFKKEGADHRYIDFNGGPADPSQILQDLNDGGGGSVFDRGTTDFQSSPKEKRAFSERTEAAFEAMFAVEEEKMAYAEPLTDAMNARDQLGGLYDHLSSQISGLETVYADLSDVMYSHVKQAALQGYSLGDVAQAWATVAPSHEYVKVAFQVMTPRLLKEQVFAGVDELCGSMDKMASARILNTRHPIIAEFSDYCETLSKLAQIRAQRDEIGKQYGEVTRFIKSAGASEMNKVAKGGKSGLLVAGAKKVQHAANTVGEHAGKATASVSKHLLGGTGKLPGKAVEYAVKAAPLAAVGVAANEAHRRAKYDPTLSKVQRTVKENLVPGSAEYDEKNYRIATRGQQYQGDY